MRKGPHPLPVHLGMAASAMQGIQDYASGFKCVLTQENAVQMVRGIQKYQQHPYKQKLLPTETIWTAQGVSIKTPNVASKEGSKEKRPVLLIPSLINKSYILDITEKKSLLRWLTRHGYEAFLLDWGDLSGANENQFDISGLIDDILSPAIQWVAESCSQPIDLIGYCMGGTLLLPSAVKSKDHIRRMVLLAAPWDFQNGSSALVQNAKVWAPTVLPVIEQKGYLPTEWIQALFASLDPLGSSQKFIKFASLDQDSSEAKLFVSVEDWLNDGINLPGGIAQHCIQDWFIGNKLVKEEWMIGGKTVQMDDIRKDILILASGRDRIVPHECASALAGNLRNARVDDIKLNCGHIGLIVGRNAVEEVWKPMVRWLENK